MVKEVTVVRGVIQVKVIEIEKEIQVKVIRKESKMPEDYISRPEFRDTTEKLFGVVNRVEKTTEKTAGVVEGMAKTVDKMFNVVYGNGKPGLVTQISNLFTMVNLDRWLLRALVLSLLSLIFFIVRQSFTN